MLIYAYKSYFHYKSLIKASRLLIFGTYMYMYLYILFNILSNRALKNFSIEINFLCILLFHEFLSFFNLLFFYCFFAEICCSHFLKHYLAKIN